MNVTVETTTKGFKFISVTYDQCIGWGGAGICDWCNKMPMAGKYVAVLNWYGCNQCFEDWHSRAEYFQQDQPVEHRNVIRMVKILSEQSPDV